MKKKLQFLLLLTCLTVACVTGASADTRNVADDDIVYPVVGGNLYFNFDSGYISGCDLSVTAANIPSIIEGEFVRGIGAQAFRDCSNLISVTLPNSITILDTSAFYDCDGLTGITLPNSIITIGDWAFSQCDGLTSMTIPDSVTTIGYGAFRCSPNLTEVFLPDSVTEIGEWAFEETGLKRIALPRNLTTVPFGMCNYCYSLTEVELPASVTSIEQQGFYGCSNLKDVYYEGSLAQRQNIKIDDQRFTDIRTGEENQPSNGPLLGDSIWWHYNSPLTSFFDVNADAYYAAPVAWAVENGITSGTTSTTFSPRNLCTNAHILTFIWAAYGRENATGSNPFTDVSSGDYYYKPAVWAAKKGVLSGTTFAPNANCTRASAVTFLWKAAGSPKSSTTLNFSDVPANAEYAQAVAWAVEKGITAGTSNTTFSPDQTCSRAQIMTFLYKAMGN